ncbi:VPS35 endosomal protein sorting factor-like [Chloropicon primus]|uniref:Uncharacterized protein n=1 Tax=Chloropicon primus TaxID=1764295 RepID=A0A5B8MYE7_9CHLO|nr:hypothetical protein A3770_13p70780 [Chloropicon primus]UPR03768.1 VPS35 endosomal protein sorting factor-like [Chloropicon primus]|eukprot:QDZ24560.1 hypothetical protein A3770_13p70780 [Chloropicon primus]
MGWCHARRYGEERQEGERRCEWTTLSSSDFDPLSVSQACGDASADNVVVDEEKVSRTTTTTTASDEEDEEKVGSASAVELEEEDFDPLSGGTGGSASGGDAERESGAGRAAQADLGGRGEDALSGIDEGEAKKFGYGVGAASYTPGYERKMNWQDWRGRRNKMLNVRSFLNTDCLSKEDKESLSVVTVNLNFQVATTVAPKDGGGGGGELSASEQRLRALEDAIESRARERSRTVGGSQLSAAAIRKQALSDQQEMVERLRLLSNDLSTAWAKNQRVVAVKIAEKTASLLEKQVQHIDFLNTGESNLDDGLMITSLVFYPAIYVFACEILDTLGDLVWDRILRKCQYEDNGTFVRSLGRVFTHESVREEASYTCRNWFLKIAGNKSLVGRIYLEASVSRCHHFLIGSTHQEELHDKVFLRLAKMCRGIAHPITSSFARMYVARRGCALLPDSSSFGFLDVLLSDVVQTFKGLAMSEVNNSPRGLHLLNIIEACLAYIVESQGKVLMAKTSSRESKNNKLKQMLRLITAGGGSQPGQMHPCSLCILQHFLRHLPHDFVLEYAVQLTQVVGSALEAEAPQESVLTEHYVAAQSECFAQLGVYLSSASVSAKTQNVVQLRKDQQRQVLNMTWRVVLKYKSLDQFLQVATTFAAFITSSFGDREINVFLQSVHKHVHAFLHSADDAESQDVDQGVPKRVLSKQHVSQIRETLLHLFGYYKETLGDLSPLFAFPSLVHLIDLTFSSSTEKVDFAETLLGLLFWQRALNQESSLSVTDPMAQQFCLDMCQLVSDAIASDINSSWTRSGGSSSRARKAGRSISTFILCCDFGGNYESHLGFLSTCRRVFHKVVEVQELCIHLACQIAARILHKSCGDDPQRHTGATLDIAKACIAFCHITIPSLPGMNPKLGLMQQAASVALMNGLVSQAESLLKAGVNMAQEAEADQGGSGRELMARAPTQASYCANFLKSCASLCLLLPGHPQKGPLYVVHGLEGAVTESSDKIALLPMVCAFAQESLPYHCKGVDSNDVLYAGDEDFHRELQEIGGKMIAEAVQGLLDRGTAVGAADDALLLAIDTILSSCQCSAVLQNKLRTLLDKVERRGGGQYKAIARRLLTSGA